MMMTKKIVTGLMIFSFFACNQANQEGNGASAGTAPVEEHAPAEETHAAELTLNKGSKWNTDESTRLHAANLMALTSAFNKKEVTSIAGYHSLAADLQKELGALVKDCRMKGADHEALHLWLSPVMKQTADLKAAVTPDEGKKITAHLTSDIQKFNQYFQNAD